jgi:hypothetical protein
MAAIYIDKGTDFLIEFTLTRDDGSLYDLTNCIVMSKIRKYPTSTKYNAFGVTIVNSTTGKLRLELDKLNTTSLTEGRNYYDVFVTDPSGRTFKVIEGEAIVYETSTTIAGEPIVTTNFGSISVDTSIVQDGYILMYDQDIGLYRFVDPDVVLEKAVRDNSLPADFIQQLDVDLDNKIDVDSGSF